MRVLFAGLFVFIGLMLFVGLIGAFLEKGSPAWGVPFGIGAAIVLILLIAAALVLFNSFNRSGDPGSSVSYAEFIQQLERDNLLTSTRFEATRAFQVPEIEDEGSHYFIELQVGDVLYLNGQYLYDYQPELSASAEADSDEVGLGFPCTDFTIRRHRVEEYVVDIQCRGSALETIYMDRDFVHADGFEDDYPSDGDTISATTYDELRARFAGRTS